MRLTIYVKEPALYWVKGGLSQYIRRTDAETREPIEAIISLARITNNIVGERIDVEVDDKFNFIEFI